MLNYRKGIPIAKISNSNKIIYLDEESTKGENHIKTNKDEKISVLPKEGERCCLYVCGMSGSGKSFFTSQYIETYHKKNPNNPIYLFSSIKEDDAFDRLRYINRVDFEHDDFFLDIGDISHFKNSLVIMDDIEILPKEIFKKLMFLVNNILQIGRKSFISMVYTSHDPCQGRATKVLLSESHIITVFPKSTGGKGLKYLLESYVGLDSNQMKKVKNLKSRAVSFIRGYPGLCVSENEIFVLSEM